MTLPARVRTFTGPGESPSPMLPFQEVSPKFPVNFLLARASGTRCLKVSDLLCFAHWLSVHSSYPFSLYPGYLKLLFAHGPL